MTTAKLAVSVIFIVLALVFAVLAFATDHWQGWIVNRKALAEEANTTATGDQKEIRTNPAYFTRHSGLFKTCYPGDDTAGMLKDRPVVDNNCIYIDYKLSAAAQYASDKSKDYWTAMHLRRLLFGLAVLGIVLLALALLSGTYGCWTVKSGGTTMTAIFLFLALLMLAGSISIVFGLNYFETHRVSEYEKSPLLAKHTYYILSWSFFVQCCSTGFCLVSFIIVSLVTCSLQRDQTLARRAAQKMRNYYDELQKQNGDLGDTTMRYENKAPSPLQKAVTEQNGDKMVPILMFDNGGFEHDTNGVLY